MIDDLQLPLDFAAPWVLLLLPLAWLPLLRRRREELTFSSLSWLPQDRLGIWIERAGRAAAVIAKMVSATSTSNNVKPRCRDGRFRTRQPTENFLSFFLGAVPLKVCFLCWLQMNTKNKCLGISAISSGVMNEA